MSLDQMQQIVLQQKQSSRNGIRSLHHKLNRAYGWIPYEEFLKLPIPVVLGLSEEIDEENQAERDEIERRKYKR